MPPRRRPSAGALSRLFDAAARPVYLIDGEARVAYLNDACARWLGIAAETLLGAPCRYVSAIAGDAPESIAAGLCPPPEVFQGARVTAGIVRIGADGATRERRCEFIPLAQIDGAAEEQSVLAIVDVDDFAAADEPPSDAARALHEALRRTANWLHGRYRPESLAGRSPAIRRVRRQVQMAAASRATVSIHGPNGSGRQHVARAIHFAQASTVGPFVPLDCGLLDEEAIASQLQSVAAAGADATSTMTVLLKDVDSAAPATQQALAARIANGTLACRWMATSTSSLDELALAGGFSAELAGLLSTIVIRLPAFAERAGDLPLVAQAMLEAVNARGERQLSGFTPEALDLLAAHPPKRGWNELAEWIQEAHERATGLFVDRAAIPDRVRYVAEAAAYRAPVEETIDLEAFLGEIELELIERALAKAKGNKTKAAELLHMTRPKFYRRLEQLGLAEGRGNDEG